jgi:heterodisulfide reductase subunit A
MSAFRNRKRFDRKRKQYNSFAVSGTDMKEDNEELKIGCFICSCGTNIAGFLDVEEVTEYAKSLPGVAFATNTLYSCSETGLHAIKEAIKDHGLNRIIVAACTPRTHEPLFQSTLAETGLCPYYFEMANIRDQCSWVHQQEREGATEKAKDLVRMAVAKASLLEPLEDISVEVEPAALVIGGGISGITTSLNLARRGLAVHLVEREKWLGGLLNDIYTLYPTNEKAEPLLKKYKEMVKKEKRITTHLNAEVASIQGYIGNYTVVLRKDKKETELKIGDIIVATGAVPFVPEGRFSYDGKRVITQMELEKLLKSGKFKARSVTMIQCVGAREKGRIYCSRICCMTAIKNAYLIKEIDDSIDVHVLYQELQTYGDEYEEYLRMAKEKGILFLRYDPDNPPVVEKGKVRVHDQLFGRDIEVPAEMVVLSTPLVAQPDAAGLAKMLKVPVDEHGFFLEAHVKLRPLDFSTDGVYLCGCAHWPSDIGESISQAAGAAAHAGIPIHNRKVTVAPIISVVDQDLCSGCGLCTESCPYGAILKDPETNRARVIDVVCKGCGICASNCPENAIRINHFKREQLSAQITAAFE